MCNNDVKDNNCYFSRDLVGFVFVKDFGKSSDLIDNAYEVINRLECYYDNRWDKDVNNKCNVVRRNWKSQLDEDSTMT